MSAQKAIVVTVDELGDATVEGRNFVGRECDAAMAPFEEALGKPVQRRNRPEYARVGEEQRERVGWGGDWRK